MLWTLFVSSEFATDKIQHEEEETVWVGLGLEVGSDLGGMKSHRLRRLVWCTGCAYSSKLECGSTSLGGKIGYGLKVSRLGDKYEDSWCKTIATLQ